MDKAAFKLETYKFTKAFIDFNIPKNAELNISFFPKGTFLSKGSRFELEFESVIECIETKSEVVRVECVASFTFGHKITIDEIPDYFFPNSLAIIFPYIRAFVSTISLQANVQPVMIPTINLMGITDELRNNTEVID